MNKEELEFWNGMEKGVNLSLEVLSDELENADENSESVISRLIELIQEQKKKLTLYGLESYITYFLQPI